MTQDQKTYLLDLAHANQAAVEQNINCVEGSILRLQSEITSKQAELANLKVKQDAQVKIRQILEGDQIPTTVD